MTLQSCSWGEESRDGPVIAVSGVGSGLWPAMKDTKADSYPNPIQRPTSKIQDQKHRRGHSRRLLSTSRNYPFLKGDSMCNQLHLQLEIHGEGSWLIWEETAPALELSRSGRLEWGPWDSAGCLAWEGWAGGGGGRYTPVLSVMYIFNPF